MHVRFRSCFALAALLLVSALPAAAQKRSSADVGVNSIAAPIPSPLRRGKRAFISYELGDLTAFPSVYSGGPERAYSEFYSEMKAWGHYDLVLDPKDADLIFAVRFVDSPGATPQVRIGITDAQTGTPLWGFVEQLNFAFRKKNRDLAFSDAVKLLVTDLQTLVTQSAPSAAPQQP